MISTLFTAGTDAFTNLWDIEIFFPVASGSEYGAASVSHSVRALGFTPPELSLNTVPVDYMGITIQKPVPKLQGNKTFTIEFRLDANYELYSKLAAWKHIYSNPSGNGTVSIGNIYNGTETTDDFKKYGKVIVYPYANFTDDGVGSTPTKTDLELYGDTITNSEDKEERRKWVYSYVICTKVGTPKYNRSDSQFATIQAEFLFGKMDEFVP